MRPGLAFSSEPAGTKVVSQVWKVFIPAPVTKTNLFFGSAVPLHGIKEAQADSSELRDPA